MLIEKIDTWIIKTIFDPISRAVQVRTGHTCYYIAWWFMGLALLVALVDMSRYFQLSFGSGGSLLEFKPGFLGEAVTFPVFMYICLTNLYKWQKLWEREKWQGSALPETRTGWWIFIRLFMVSVCFIGVISGAIDGYLGKAGLLDFFLSVSDFYFLTIAEYFAACTPMPPGSQMKKERAAASGLQSPAVHQDAA